MAGSTLVFDLLAKDRASEVFRHVAAESKKTGAELDRMSLASGGHFDKLAAAGKAAFLGIAGGAAIAGVVSVKMAGEFQTSTSVLQTAAGETSAGLKIVRSGILDIAKSTGTTWQNLSEGMYQVEKAGYRGADGLKVLKAAAQGAKEENANLEVVTNAMTSVMASYHIPTSKSVQVMNALKTAAAGSKDTMQNFAGSLSTVLPIASAAHLDFAQVGGAIAGLTRHGTSAAEATQELANTIRNLQAPNKVAIKTMEQWGVSSTDVSAHLGTRGLGGTLDYLVGVIAKKMGPSGLVLQDAFAKSKSASADLKAMLGSMSGPARKLADDLLSNSVSLSKYRGAASKLPVDQAVMARQFATLATHSRGFSDALKTGGPAATTMASLLKKMLGGSTGLNTALMLTGENTAYVSEMTKKTADSMTHASKNVEGWDQTQKLFNTRLDRFKQTVNVLAINIGTKLIPVLTDAMDWMGKHKTVLKDSAIAVGTLVTGLIALKAVQMVMNTVTAVSVAVQTLALARTEGLTIAQAAAAVTGEAMTGSMVALDAALNANPIGLVVIAIGLLVAGLVIAYKKSEVFRDVVTGVFQLVKIAALTLATVAVDAFRLILTIWLETAGGILHGAAIAFGWLPGLGGKLKSADKAFRGMKDAVLGTMDKLSAGLHAQLDKTVRDVALQSALTGIAMKKGIADRLPAYEALAAKYGMTLPQVLDRAKLDAKAKAKLMGLATAQGLVSGAGQVATISRHIAGEPGHAFDKAQGSTKVKVYALGYATGQQVALGLQAGMSSGQVAAVKKAQYLGWSVAMAAKHGAEVRSPSVITTYVGKMIAQGLIVGLQSKSAEVRAASKTQALIVLQHIQSTVQTALTAAKRGYAQITAARAGFMQQITDGIGSGVDSAFSATQQGGSGSLVDNLQRQLGKTQQFSSILQAVAKQGGNQALLSKLAGLGVDDGTAMGQQLLESHGVKAASALMAQVNAAGTALAKSSADLFYAHGVAISDGLVKGLTSRLDHVKAAVTAVHGVSTRQAAVHHAAAVKHVATTTRSQPTVHHSTRSGSDSFTIVLPPGTTEKQARAMLTEFRRIKRESGQKLGLD